MFFIGITALKTQMVESPRWPQHLRHLLGQMQPCKQREVEVSRKQEMEAEAAVGGLEVAGGCWRWQPYLYLSN